MPLLPRETFGALLGRDVFGIMRAMTQTGTPYTHETGVRKAFAKLIETFSIDTDVSIHNMTDMWLLLPSLGVRRHYRLFYTQQMGNATPATPSERIPPLGIELVKPFRTSMYAKALTNTLPPGDHPCDKKRNVEGSEPNPEMHEMLVHLSHSFTISGECGTQPSDKSALLDSLALSGAYHLEYGGHGVVSGIKECLTGSHYENLEEFKVTESDLDIGVRRTRFMLTGHSDESPACGKGV